MATYPSSPAVVPWVHAFVDVPEESAEAARAFWSAALGWPSGAPWDGRPEFTSFVPPTGTPYVHVQVVGAPPGVHLDLLGDPATDPDRLERLGATPSADRQVLRSPADLPFCLGAEPGSRTRPPAVMWSDGHRTRLVQLCIDAPEAEHDREFEFWQAATGWAEEPIEDPEFRRLVHRTESPLQLLVQRLGPDDGAERARAHLDLGTDDRAAEIARLEALGAHVLWPGAGFTAMQDPVGLPFCVTGNDPTR